MSLSVLSTGKTIQNNSLKIPGFDISTRNLEMSTLVGYLAGEKNRGFFNTFVGRAAGQENDSGASNVFMGNDAGNSNVSGNANTFIGVGAGGGNILGDDNIFMGLSSGEYNTTGKRNVFVGNYTGTRLNGMNNILIGFSSSTCNLLPNSSNNIGIGTGTQVFGYVNTAVGTNNFVVGKQTAVFGNSIKDSGDSSVLIGKNITNTGKSNIIIWTKSNVLVNSNNNLINLNDRFVLGGDDGSSSFKLDADMFYIGNSNNNIDVTPSNFFINASNNFAVRTSNTIVLDNGVNKVQLDQEKLALYSKSNIIINTNDNLLVQTATGTFVSSSNAVQISNPCNHIALEDESMFLESKCGSIINNFADDFIVESINSNVSFELHQDGTAELRAPQGVSISGHVKADAGMDVVDGVALYKPNNSNVFWKEDIILTSSNAADLVFYSGNGTTVTFVDDFAPDVLNFTGKHRCMLEESGYSKKDLIGRLVVSTGKYQNLNNSSELEMDEAIPIVRLSDKAYDKRVFGVIGGFDGHGLFHIGNIKFFKSFGAERAIIQNVGEGCILVCDLNGPLENGDLIVSSPLPGLGMKQNNEIVTCSTVAKSTCDCDFKNSLNISYLDKHVRFCLVGCKYY